LGKEKKTFGRFQLEAPRAYKCKQILGLCQCMKVKVVEEDPSHIINMDQTLIPYSFHSSRCLK